MSDSVDRSVWKSAGLLTVVVLAAWVVAFWPARSWNGMPGLVWMTVAASSCLVPGWIVVILSRLVILPNDLTALLLQVIVRMGLVAGVAIGVRLWRPDVGIKLFYGWLIGFYLLALAAEAVLTRQKRGKPTSSGVDATAV